MHQRFSLFAYGFRPHFLLSGVAALVFVPWWVGVSVAGWPLASAWPPSLWHAHELLFGFLGAAIGGFLLTAVPSWTAKRGFAGRPLVIASSLWLLARLLIATGTLWPPLVVAAVDMGFVLAIAALIAPLLLREGNRNAPMLLLLAALTVVNGAFHWFVARGDSALAARSLVVGLDIVLVLITIIGGRIVPAFTSSALKQQGRNLNLAGIPGLTPVLVTLMIAVTVMDALLPAGRVAGVLALLVAVLHLLRLTRWHTLYTLREPIVWVLHLGYLWMAVGFALKAAALLGHWVPGTYWLHALSVGAAGTMVMAVMTRATLGHTGRPIRATPLIAFAYVLVTLAAIVRVFGPFAGLGGYGAVLVTAATLWGLGYGLFVLIYAPILIGPRIDGKPG